MTEPPASARPKQAWRKPPRLYEEVARDIADAISQGDYAPGQFLPTEFRMVEAYHTSRNAIREALKMLSARGMVEVLHGRGSRVLPRERWQLTDQLVNVMREDPRVPRDLLELRRILEVEIAGLAAQRITADRLDAMQVTIDQMREAVLQPEACIEHDIQFHQLLAEAAENVLLPLVLNPVEQLLRAGRLATIHNVGSVDRSIAAHCEVLDRVAAHDVEGARHAMQRHLMQVEGELRQIADHSTVNAPYDAAP